MQIAMFFIGLMAGGFFGVVTMCCLQLKRTNEYEQEIHRLKNQLSKK